VVLLAVAVVAVAVLRTAGEKLLEEAVLVLGLVEELLEPCGLVAGVEELQVPYALAAVVAVASEQIAVEKHPEEVVAVVEELQGPCELVVAVGVVEFQVPYGPAAVVGVLHLEQIAGLAVVVG